MSKPATIEAIEAGDESALRAILSTDPTLAQARDGNGVSAIMHALYRRQTALLDQLLSAGGELDIFEAASLGRIERVAGLLRADPGLASNYSGDGFTPLHFACFFGQEGIALLLLQHGAGADAVARNPMRVTPLHSAAATRNLSILRALLEHGANPNARQQQGWTALHAAAQNGDVAMIELLLSSGADPVLANDDGLTPVAVAEKFGHPQAASLLSVKPRATG